MEFVHVFMCVLMLACVSMTQTEYVNGGISEGDDKPFL